jgi:hypothetical protein
MRPSCFRYTSAPHAALFLAAAAMILPLRAVDLKLDVNQRSTTNNVPANTEGGFQALALDPMPTGALSGTFSRTFGAQTVTLTSSLPGTVTYDDRKRAAPTNTGGFTQQAILQDFIFSIYSAAVPDSINGGLNIEIAGLTPGKEYAVTLWSYDNGSTGSRVSDWSANGVLKVEDYTFNGSTLPATNEQHQMNFTSTADGSGKILIEGRRDSNNTSHGVFLNGLWVRDLFEDTEPDGMADGWETAHGLSVGNNDSALDPDNDTSTNLQEFQADTDPQDNDSDNDTLLDGYENKSGAWVSAINTGTHPLAPDTDGDGLGDALENPDLPWAGPSQPGTNPNLADSDGDTFFDGEEVNWPSSPRDALQFPNPAAGGTLAVDLENLIESRQPGFEVIMGTDTAGVDSVFGIYGPYTVTITAAGSTNLQGRDRGTTSAVGGFTPMFRDFIFAQTSDTDGDGLDVTITGLAPLTWYPVTLWSWDPTSAGTPRHSTWLAGDGNNPPAVKVPLYVLDNAAALPASANDRRMKFDALSDSSGQLVIQGRKEDGYTGSTINVFLNAFVIGPPVTPIRFTAIAGPQLTWTSDDIGVYRVRTSPDLTQWTTLNGAVDGQAGTTSFTDTTVPAGTMRRFYQVDRVSP